MVSQNWPAVYVVWTTDMIVRTDDIFLAPSAGFERRCTRTCPNSEKGLSTAVRALPVQDGARGKLSVTLVPHHLGRRGCISTEHGPYLLTHIGTFDPKLRDRRPHIMPSYEAVVLIEELFTVSKTLRSLYSYAF